MLEVEAMTENTLHKQFDRDDFLRLEGELRLRASVLGWTGDPLKQPQRAVLASARAVLAEKEAA